MGEGENRYNPAQYPDKTEWSRKYSGDELRTKDPQWVACYLFSEQQSTMNAGIRLGDLFPNLSNEQINQYTMKASFWWTDKVKGGDKW